MASFIGRKRFGFTLLQWWMFAVGSGLVLTGWYRWPEPLRNQVRSLSWNMLVALLPS